MSEPLISIIVPVYNVEKYLPKCLDSLVNQTYKNLEIICINDGSQDDSFIILKKYEEQDKRIKIISQKNSGVSVARNTALNMAIGKYIMFVDGDDWIEVDTCQIALEVANKYNSGIVMWDYIREFDNSSLPKNIFNEDVIFEKNDIKIKLHRRMIGIIGEELRHPEDADSLCTVWGKLYRSDCVYKRNIKFYNIHEIGTYEDGLFNLNVFANIQKAVYIHKYLYHYRKNNTESLTSSYKFDLQEKHENLHKYMRKYITENKLGVEYLQALNNRIALELVGYGLNILNLNKNKVFEIKKILSNKYYKESYKQLDFKYFPIHWKIFYGCAKYNFATGIYMLLLCIKKMIGR